MTKTMAPHHHNIIIGFLVFFSHILMISTLAANNQRPTKLFVFGDSYADTGNVDKSLADSWKPPYGTTFPGKPTGRFSDGRLLTDYLAEFLGLESPSPHTSTKNGAKNGLNFAYGGSGVFYTFSDLLPNMSTQIGFFEQLLHQSVYNKNDVHSSVSLVVLSGNDYTAYLLRGGSTLQGLQKFVPVVINQLSTNLERIIGLGANKVVVSGLDPVGCLPQITQASSFQKCNSSLNELVDYHNRLLKEAVARLNNKSSTKFFILDLYTSFTTVLQNKGNNQGDLKFETPLKPCCVGTKKGYSCGSVDKKTGQKMYTVCSEPKSSFFWDMSHPTEAGWRAVYQTLKSSLEGLLN